MKLTIPDRSRLNVRALPRKSMKTTDPVRLPLRLLPMTVLALLALFTLVMAAQAAMPTPPQFMAYQGFLTDGNGNPLGSTNTGPKNYNVIFRIWDNQSGGSSGTSDELYAEQQTLTVNNGYFSVLLGNGSPVGTEPHGTISGVFTNTAANTPNRYVETQVLGIGPSGGNITIAPRLQLITSPYSFLAANANYAGTAATLVNPTNGSTAVSVAPATGYVGVGTSTPAQQLEVSGSAQIDQNLQVSGGATVGWLSASSPSTPSISLKETTHSYETDLATASGSGAWSSSASAGDTVLRNLSGKLLLQNGSGAAGLTISGNNYVGIGTNSPAQSLEVAGNAQIDGNSTAGQSLYVGNTLLLDVNNLCNATVGSAAAFAHGFQFGGTGSGEGFFCNRAANSLNPYGITFLTGFQPRLAIANQGNVGIGTTNPAATLQVGGHGTTFGTASSTLLTDSGSIGQSVGNNIALSTFGFGSWGHAGSAAIRAQTVTTGNGDWGNVAIGLGYDVDSTANAGGALWIYNNHIGIGTTTPAYPLDVEANVNKTISGYSSLSQTSGGFPNGFNTGYNSSGNGNFSIYTSGRIACNTELDIISDARVKEVVGRSDTAKDLSTVRRLQITDYYKVDKVQCGNWLQKGVLAQEVEKIIPEAVSTSTNFIPNIYAPAKAFACTNETMVVTTVQPHGLVVGDVVKLYTDNEELKVPVTAVPSPRQFTVAQAYVNSKHLFIFGKQVGDFREVNYDRLFTTGLGAIQELAAKAEADEAKVQELTSQVAELKKLVVKLAEASSRSQTAEGANPVVTGTKPMVMADRAR